ncbi:DsbA family oxidoreductase [Porticoccus sp. GXU_MW_L64]
MNSPLIINYYTDILCVWAWIAQRRIDELNQQLRGKIDIQHHYMDVFGDVPGKMHNQWESRGGYPGFAEHVQKSAAAFEEIPINPKLWTDVKPATSANAHLMIKAVEQVYGQSKSTDVALKLRSGFFLEALDIGDMRVLYQLLEAQGLDKQALADSVASGTAMAALMRDYQQAKQQGIKGSPSYVIDGGRQTLYGNVGYRVLLANIEELLKHPDAEASWC